MINIFHYIFSSRIGFMVNTLAIIGISMAANAQGNLVISPMRVVFEGGKRGAEINIANSGADSARYLLSFVEQRMKETGQMEVITEPDSGQFFASKYLRLFPRSIYLGPNESQVVRLQLRNASQLKPGEYRSHLYFRSAPMEQPLGDTAKPVEKGTISIKLKAVFGITIPVIIRIGEDSTTITIDSPKLTLTDTTAELKCDFYRHGNFSTYGALTVDYISENGKQQNVGIAKGIGIYTPNKKRTFVLQLKSPKEIDYHKGKLKVGFDRLTEPQINLVTTELKLE